ncbi:hypothetical protein GIB67_030890 [Kingdonia uniflora]|uniref:Ribosomal protein L19 n=1 Tax=Kingdonia uniflora TaxID=39325 RepID=A0A7J7L3B7_9MAGN|nr:hypothetical protein GIB67_030890 [Kingdonia uniflora]
MENSLGEFKAQSNETNRALNSILQAITSNATNGQGEIGIGLTDNLTSLRGRGMPLGMFMRDTRRFGFSPTHVERVERGRDLSTRANLDKEFDEEGAPFTSNSFEGLDVQDVGSKDKFADSEEREVMTFAMGAICLDESWGRSPLVWGVRNASTGFQQRQWVPGNPVADEDWDTMRCELMARFILEAQRISRFKHGLTKQIRDELVLFNAQSLSKILDREAVAEVRAQRDVVEDIRPGYIVQFKVEVPENKRRVSTVKGIVIARRNAGLNTTFRIRRLVAGVGVESLYHLYSPNIKELKVLNKKSVRRAKLYYLRDKMNALKKSTK